MRITFAGCGNAFTDHRYYQSNIILTIGGQKLLVDCGSDARFSLGELGCTNANVSQWIDAVYISHLHADHIGGLEWLAFSSYFNQVPKKPKLFIADTLVHDLWRTLEAGLRSITGSQATLDTFFDVHPVSVNEGFSWQNASFSLIQTVHVIDGRQIVPSYGLIAEQNASTIFITTDTLFSRHMEPFYEQADLIFQDCETTVRKSNIHAHYDDLKTIDAKYKNKMWLYHYAPSPSQTPEKDGFCGFVTKGQTFDIEEFGLKN